MVLFHSQMRGHMIKTIFVGESDPCAATATVCKTITVEHTSCVNGGANQEFWLDK